MSYCILSEVEQLLPAKHVLITLGREELLYDIANALFIEAHSLSSEARDIKTHIVIDAVQDGNRDRIIRTLDLSFSDLTERLSPLTDRIIVNSNLFDFLRDRKAYGFLLKVDLPAATQGRIDLIAKLLHEIMVCNAVADWLRITLPDSSDSWNARAQEALARLAGLRARLCGRNGIRRKQHWFF